MSVAAGACSWRTLRLALLLNVLRGRTSGDTLPCLDMLGDVTVALASRMGLPIVIVRAAWMFIGVHGGC